MVPLPFLKKWNHPLLYIRPDLVDYQNKVIPKNILWKKSKILALKSPAEKKAFFLFQYDFIQKRPWKNKSSDWRKGVDIGYKGYLQPWKKFSSIFKYFISDYGSRN